MTNRQRLATLALLAACPLARCQLANTTNYNHTVPAAPTGSLNVHWQNDGGHPTVNISAYALYPTIQVNCPSTGDLSGPVLAASAALSASGGGILDARRCTGAFSWNNRFTFATANTALLLPCVTLTVTQPVIVNPGMRNTTIHGCAYQGGSAASGTVGGSVWNWQGTGPAFIVGDTADLTDTGGFSISDMAVVTASADSAATAFAFHRVQEINMERLYVIGNNGTGQTGILLDGKGNYSGGSFISLHVSGFGSQLAMTGDATGGANASTFVRAHFNCPTSGGSPIAGTIGVSLAYGDGNTFTGGDIESCDTMLFLGAGASNNTFTGVRNENSNSQIVALSGSQYNLWLTGGTMFTGKLTDSGTHNSFVDTFHRTWNNLNGDLWRSQADATVTNHVYTGVGLGHVRGRQDEWQTDVPGTPGSYQNAWLWGPGDGTTGLQLWELKDVINNVSRFGVQQLTTAGGNNQTYLSGAGTGGVCINCSAGAGSGGFSVASGGATPGTVFSVGSTGNTTVLGQVNFYSGSTEAWEFECANTASCAIFNASATTPASVFKAFTNGATLIASQGSSAVVINNTSTGGTGGFIVYQGGANYNTAAFTIAGNGSFSSASNGQVGSASGTGNLALGNHLNQLATADFAGHCSMSSSSSCTVSFQHSWGSIPACGITPQFAVGNRIYYTWATNVITVHSTGTETGQFGVVCAGDPN
jgi:hypothetical protein